MIVAKWLERWPTNQEVFSSDPIDAGFFLLFSFSTIFHLDANCPLYGFSERYNHEVLAVPLGRYKLFMGKNFPGEFNKWLFKSLSSFWPGCEFAGKLLDNSITACKLRASLDAIVSERVYFKSIA